jgi:hypothetical protein
MPLHGGILCGGIFVAHVVKPIAEARNDAPIRTSKVDRTVAIAPDLEAPLVQQRVMKRAE